MYYNKYKGNISSNKNLEIMELFADASLKNIDKRDFVCSGAICINTSEERYTITADSTSNRGEILAVFLAIQMAHENLKKYPNRFKRINVYSDSQLSVLGTTKYMHTWIKNSTNDQEILYKPDNKPVQNQDLLMMVVTYCVANNLIINMYDQKAHVNLESKKSLIEANKYFYKANGFYLKKDEIYKISHYNGLIDKKSRDLLQYVNPNQYPRAKFNNKELLCHYIVPTNFWKYIHIGGRW